MTVKMTHDQIADALRLHGMWLLGEEGGVQADLRGADLSAYGNMRELRTMQIDLWEICYTHDTLQIGCQRHQVDKWRKWNTDAGRVWIARMDGVALEWADRNLALVLQIIDANPAHGGV